MMKSRSSMLVFFSLFLYITILVITLILRVTLDPALTEAYVNGLIAVCGAYLGVDFASVITQTAKLEAGQFQKANTKKYLTIIATMFAILLLMLYSNYIIGSDIKEECATMIKGSLGLTTIYIAGMKGNKVATGVKSQS